MLEDPITPECEHARHADCDGYAELTIMGWPSLTSCGCDCHDWAEAEP